MTHIYFGLFCFVTVLLYGIYIITNIKHHRTTLEEIVGLEEDAKKEKIQKFRFKVKIDFLQRIILKSQQAGLSLKVSEVEIIIAAFISAVVSFFALKTLFSTPFVGCVGIPIGLYMPIYYLNSKIRKRGDLLAKQLFGCLIMWANSIRAGASLAQAIEKSIDRVPPELNEELKQIKHDIDLGLLAVDALEKAMERIPVAEYKMVCMTARIWKQLGGNLAERFESIAATIEDRVATRANLKAYTTQARLGATVAGLMPFVVLIILKFLSPDYLEPMVKSPHGTFMLMVAVVLIFAGWYIIRRIGDIRLN